MISQNMLKAFFKATNFQNCIYGSISNSKTLLILSLILKGGGIFHI